MTCWSCRPCEQDLMHRCPTETGCLRSWAFLALRFLQHLLGPEIQPSSELPSMTTFGTVALRRKRSTLTYSVPQYGSKTTSVVWRLGFCMAALTPMWLDCNRD